MIGKGAAGGGVNSFPASLAAAAATAAAAADAADAAAAAADAAVAADVVATLSSPLGAEAARAGVV